MFVFKNHNSETKRIADVWTKNIDERNYNFVKLMIFIFNIQQRLILLKECVYFFFSFEAATIAIAGQQATEK